MSDTAAAAPDAPVAKPKPKDGWRENLTFLLKLALIVFVLRSFIVSPFSIPSESMLPRLFIGDYLFVSKWNYGYSRWSLPWGVPLIPGRLFARDPARGDVVVFRGPPGEDHDVIKRVIGLPGDTVQMRAGQVILNGKPIPKQQVADFTIPLSPNYDERRCAPANQDMANGQPICRYAQFKETLPSGVSYLVLDRGEVPADDTDVYQVPADHVFVMGDNRDDSADSRFPAPPNAAAAAQGGYGMGYVPMDHIEGKALVSFWSTDGSAKWLLPWTWLTAARWNRMGKGY